jgi:membrane-bound lytic murein transglycosylase D
MVKHSSNRWSARPGRRELVALGLAGALGLSALHIGSQRALERFGPKDDGSTATVADEVRPFTLASGEWDLPNIDHPRIDFWIERLQGSMRAEFTEFLERSGRYGPMISAQLAERGMPQDLIFLSMIESGFKPTAYSPAHAAGLWQFISETGQHYGLTVNAVVDERQDPVKSTDAGLDYLEYLYGRFDSWYLAAAAYNSGENRVARIMREVTGSEKGTDQDYYRIWERLPRETRDYVPLIMAAARVSKDPERYGFVGVRYEAPLAFEEVEAEPGTTLEQVARAVGAAASDITRLNPHLRQRHVPTNRSYLVRVPEGLAAVFEANFERVKREEPQLALASRRSNPAPRAATPAAACSHRVRQGENLSVIARRHGITVSSLRSANSLRGDRIRAGQTLSIPSR